MILPIPTMAHLRLLLGPDAVVIEPARSKHDPAAASKSGS